MSFAKFLIEKFKKRAEDDLYGLPLTGIQLRNGTDYGTWTGQMEAKVDEIDWPKLQADIEKLEQEFAAQQGAQSAHSR